MRLFWSTLLISISNFNFGFNTGVIAGVILLITEDFPQLASPLWSGLFAGSILLGGITGALVSFPAADLMGRRKTLLYTNLFYLAGPVLCSVTPPCPADASTATFVALLGMLLVTRYLTGIGVGVTCALANLYVSEISPAKKRGALGGIAPLMGTLGIVSSYIACALLPLTGLSWRFVVLVPVLPALLQLYCKSYLCESPRWLLMTNQLPRAIQTLTWLLAEEPSLSPSPAPPRPAPSAAPPSGADPFPHTKPPYRYTQVGSQDDASPEEAGNGIGISPLVAVELRRIQEELLTLKSHASDLNIEEVGTESEEPSPSPRPAAASDATSSTGAASTAATAATAAHQHQQPHQPPQRAKRKTSPTPTPLGHESPHAVALSGDEGPSAGVTAVRLPPSDNGVLSGSDDTSPRYRGERASAGSTRCFGRRGQRGEAGGSGVGGRERVPSGQVEERVRMREVWSAKYRRPLFVAIALNALQQLSGINAIVYYAPEVFNRVGFDKTTSVRVTAVVASFQLVMLYLVVKLIDRVGRKPLAYLGLTGMSVSLLLIALAFAIEPPLNPPHGPHPHPLTSVHLHTNMTAIVPTENGTFSSGLKGLPPLRVGDLEMLAGVGNGTGKESDGDGLGYEGGLLGAVGEFVGASALAVVGVLSMKLFFSLSLGPLPYIITTELFPSRVRAAGVSSAWVFNWLFNFVVTFATPKCLEVVPSLTFVSFAVFALLSLPFIMLYLPETKGKTLEDLGRMTAKS
ncbi:unnamed protein product [Vitrella brassicaformis CCMP3155]|uniref:Hexose transporter 1 n=1 Tax=Vitrella brassicaformis (strain CCMP3155) TaxID=1169540 RepID=A0A0G4F0E9_VITBC|nr:unnamed protein product [Vitrella brassicaformis CCMP3155]|eukprot:CEM04741.1 unnamed protein product [Vitrella brassicaformis CCMP3155]